MSAAFFTRVCRVLPEDTDELRYGLYALDMAPLSLSLKDFIDGGVLVEVDDNETVDNVIEFAGGDTHKLSIRVKSNIADETISLTGLMGFVGDLSLIKNKKFVIDFEKMQSIALSAGAIAATGLTEPSDKTLADETAIYIAMKTFARSVRDTVNCLHACGISTRDIQVPWDGGARTINNGNILKLCDDIDALLAEDYRESKDKVLKLKSLISPINKLLDETLYNAEVQAKMTWITKRIYEASTEPSQSQMEAALRVQDAMSSGKTLILDMAPGSGKTAIELLPILLAPTITSNDESLESKKKAPQRKRILIATSLQMVSAKIAERAAEISPWPSLIPVKRVDGGVQAMKMTPFYSKRLFWEATISKKTSRNIFMCTQSLIDNCPLTNKMKSMETNTRELMALKKRVTNSGALLSHRRWDWSDESHKHNAEVLVGTFEGIAKILEQIDIDEIGALVIDEWDELLIDPSDASRNVRAEAAVALQAWSILLSQEGVPVIMGSGTASSIIDSNINDQLIHNLESDTVDRISPDEYVAAHQTEFIRMLHKHGIDIYREAYSNIKAMIRETDSLFGIESLQKCIASLATAEFDDGYDDLKMSYDMLLRGYFIDVAENKQPARGFKAQARALLGVAILFRAGVAPPPATEPFFQFIYAVHCQAAHREYLGNTIFTIFCQSKNDMQSWAYLLTAILAVISAPLPSKTSTYRLLLSLVRNGNNNLLDDIYVNTAISGCYNDMFIPACIINRHSDMISDHIALPSTMPLVDIAATGQNKSMKISVRNTKSGKTETMPLKSCRQWCNVFDIMKTCARDTAEQLSRGVVTINAELMTNTAIEDLIAQRPYFVITTNKLGAGVDTPHIGVTAVVSIKKRMFVSNSDQMQWLARGFRNRKCSLRFSMAPYVDDDSLSVRLINDTIDDEGMILKNASTELSNEVGIMSAKARSSSYIQGIAKPVYRRGIQEIIDTIFRYVNFAGDIKTVSVIDNVCHICRPCCIAQYTSQQLPRIDNKMRAKTCYSVLKDSACAPVETLRKTYNSLSGLLSNDLVISSLMFDGCNRFAPTCGDPTGDSNIDSIETTRRLVIKLVLAIDTPASSGNVQPLNYTDVTTARADAVGVFESSVGTFKAQLIATVETPDNIIPPGMDASRIVMGAQTPLTRLCEHLSQQYRIWKFAQTQSETLDSAVNKLFPHLFKQFVKNQIITYTYDPHDPSMHSVDVTGTLSEDIGCIFGSDIILSTMVSTIASILSEPVTTVKVNAGWHRYNEVAATLSIVDIILGSGIIQNILPCNKKIDTFAAPQTVYNCNGTYTGNLADILQHESARGMFIGLRGIAQGRFNNETFRSKDMDRARPSAIYTPELCDNPVAAVFTSCLRRLDIDHRSVCAKLRAPLDDNTTIDKPGISNRAFALMRGVYIDSGATKAARDAWTEDSEISGNATEESSTARKSRVSLFMRGFTTGTIRLHDFLMTDHGIAANQHHPYRHLIRKYVMTYFSKLDIDNKCNEIDNNNPSRLPTENDAAASVRNHTQIRIELPYKDQETLIY